MGNGNSREPTQNELILKQMIGAVRLHKVGNSHMVVVPKEFLQTFGDLIDGCYWVRLDQGGDNNDTMIVRPVKREDLQVFDNNVTITPREAKQ